METSQNKQFSCPMKCEDTKTYNQPGDCPVCNMKLVPADGDHNHSDQTNDAVKPARNCSLKLLALLYFLNCPTIILCKNRLYPLSNFSAAFLNGFSASDHNSLAYKLAPADNASERAFSEFAKTILAEILKSTDLLK